MTKDDKAKRLKQFCELTGHELNPETFEMWVSLPDIAFSRKMTEWGQWSALGGRMEF